MASALAGGGVVSFWPRGLGLAALGLALLAAIGPGAGAEEKTKPAPKITAESVVTRVVW